MLYLIEVFQVSLANISKNKCNNKAAHIGVGGGGGGIEDSALQQNKTLGSLVHFVVVVTLSKAAKSHHSQSFLGT